MCLGEVIIGDVTEALEMPFGRQMVRLNPRAPFISRNTQSSGAGQRMCEGHVHVCVPALEVEAVGHDPLGGYRASTESFKTHQNVYVVK